MWTYGRLARGVSIGAPACVGDDPSEVTDLVVGVQRSRAAHGSLGALTDRISRTGGAVTRSVDWTPYGTTRAPVGGPHYTDQLDQPDRGHRAYRRVPLGTKPQKRKQVEAALRAQGCSPLRNRGGHEVWGCPCGKHTAPLPNHGEVSAGVIRSIARQMDCLTKGWLA